jgi:aminomethyltransferase
MTNKQHEERKMKKTAFHEINLEYGAQMREMFGYYLPWEYKPGHFEEHIGTRQRVSLCDLDYMGEFRIEGPDALNFLQKVFTNDYSKQAIGAIRYTAMCNDKGNMVDDGTVWKFGDTKFILISGDEADYDWLTENSKDFNVTVKNITAEHTTLALQGPKSKDVLAKITDCDLDAIRYYHFKETKVDGVDCIVDRLGYTGEFGYELHFHPQYGRQMWTTIMHAGKAFNIVPCGQAALESLRQEAGYLLVGNDHDKNTNPLEAGIGWTVKFGKGDFNGKQALLNIARQGVKRRLVWFKLMGGEVANKGDAIFSGGTRVGEVTSGSYSPTSKTGTAMGYVLPQFAIPGIDFIIEIAGHQCQAKLSVMPLYDPGNVLTKG